MKRCLLVWLVAINLAFLSGCGKDHDTVGDAPRTESASNLSGWKEISTSGIALQLPSDWKAMEISRETLERGEDKVFGNDPKMAAMRSQATALAKQGAVKLFAVDTSSVSTGFATNCNVAVIDEPGQPTLEQVADATVLQVTPMTADGKAPRLEYPTFKSGKAALVLSKVKSPNPAIPALLSLLYISHKGSKFVTVTFTGIASDEPQLRKVAEQSMDTFRFTN